jgi:hypothetical protein
MPIDYKYDLPNATDGLDTILVQTTLAVSGFTYLLLVFVYFVVFLGGFGRQQVRNGIADYPMWSVVASISTLMIALIMSAIEELIHLDVLIVVLVVTIFSGVWLFLDRKNTKL